MALRVIAAILLIVWLLLVLLGKGGLVHILLLNAVGIAAVDLVRAYRRQMTI